MAEKPYPWFRYYSEAASDIKFNVIAHMCEMSRLEVIGAWTLILCAANASPVRGALYVTLQKRYSNVTVTELVTLPQTKVDALLNAFIEMDMLEIVDGAFCVRNWEKRQFESDLSSERVRKYRQKHTETLQKRYCNVSVTPPDTDTDTELINNATSKKPVEVGELSEVEGWCIKYGAVGTTSPNAVNALIEMEKAGVIEQDIQIAVAALRSGRKKYTIVGPQSILTATLNQAGIRKAKPPDKARMIETRTGVEYASV